MTIENYLANKAAFDQNIIDAFENIQINLRSNENNDLCAQSLISCFVGLGISKINHYTTRKIPSNGIIADMTKSIGFENESWQDSMEFISPFMNYKNLKNLNEFDDEIHKFTTYNKEKHKKISDPIFIDLNSKTYIYDSKNNTNYFPQSLIDGAFYADNIRNEIVSRIHDKKYPKRDDYEQPYILKYAPKKINHALIIGAGGLGTFCTYILTKAKTQKITLVDFDKIETTNLNRQLFYYGATGEFKSLTLAKRLSTPDTKIIAQIDNFDEKYRIESQIDAIFCCTDNHKSRLLASRLAQKNQIPLIEGGCTPIFGCVSCYLPNLTKSVEEQRNLVALIELEGKQKKQEQPSNSCTRLANPSVIMPNMIIGTLQAVSLLDEKKFEESESSKFIDAHKKKYLNLYDNIPITLGGI